MVATAAALAAATRYAIIPQPVVLIPQEGEFELSQSTPIVAPREFAGVATFAKELVSGAKNTATSTTASIRFKLNKHNDDFQPVYLVALNIYLAMHNGNNYF